MSGGASPEQDNPDVTSGPKILPVQNFFVFMNKKIIIGIIVIFLAILAGRNVLNTTPPDLPLSREEKPKEKSVLQKTEYSFTATQESTVYDLMKKLKTEGETTFTEKTYAGMGKLIDSINGVRSNGEKTWIYYVNGKRASVGVSNYKLKPGDVVSWKYEKLLAY